MKIAVITLHRIVNYGSVLQTYATQKILEKLGHQVEIIDYCDERMTMKGMLRRIKTKSQVLHNPFICKIAAQFIYAGYKIAYVGTAGVWHSHNYSLKQQYTRNFDVSAFMTMHPDLFANISATSEGIKMVKWVEKKLLSQGRIFSAAYYVVESFVKFMANRKGRDYKNMGLAQLRKCSMHKNYWA